MNPFSAIVIDDHPLVRASISLLLQKDNTINVVLESGEGKDAIGYLHRQPADLLILDIELPDMDGLDVFRHVHATRPETKVLFLSAKDERVYATKAIQMGANGFISKHKDLEEIYTAAKMILSGYSFFPADLLNHLKRSALNKGGKGPLTGREITILQHIVLGETNKVIANYLNISEKTVSTHKTNIKQKLNLVSIVELIDYAKQNNLI